MRTRNLFVALAALLMAGIALAEPAHAGVTGTYSVYGTRYAATSGRTDRYRALVEVTWTSAAGYGVKRRASYANGSTESLSGRATRSGDSLRVRFTRAGRTLDVTYTVAGDVIAGNVGSSPRDHDRGDRVPGISGAREVRSTTDAALHAAFEGLRGALAVRGFRAFEAVLAGDRAVGIAERRAVEIAMTGAAWPVADRRVPGRDALTSYLHGGFGGASSSLTTDRTSALLAELQRRAVLPAAPPLLPTTYAAARTGEARVLLLFPGVRDPKGGTKLVTMAYLIEMKR